MEEILAVFLSALAEVFGEFLWQLAVQFVVEVLFDELQKKPRARSPALRVVTYGCLGALTGFLSLLLVRRHFIRDPTMRLINLAVSPWAAGAVMAIWRKHRRRIPAFSRKIHFVSGALFAFAFALVRYLTAG